MRRARPKALSYYHMPVRNLLLDRPLWRVGPAVFLQQGSLRRHIEGRQQRRSRENEDYERAERRGLDELKTATVRVRARSAEEAAEHARDAIAVARLFQRVVLPGWNLDDQTFGLTEDVGSPVERYWSISTGSKARGHGWRRFGIGASWTFTRDMLRRIDEDPRFGYLSDVLDAGDARTELGRRIVLSLRFLNLATVMVPPPIRVATQGLAMEVLLSDAIEDGLMHRVARRAAYLTCGGSGTRHGVGGRPACPILALSSERKLETELRNARRRRRAAGCDWYAQTLILADARNEVMHLGREDFPKLRPSTFESWIDDVILELVDWSIRTRATSIAELDREIADLVDVGVEWWSHDTRAAKPKVAGSNPVRRARLPESPAGTSPSDHSPRRSSPAVRR